MGWLIIGPPPHKYHALFKVLSPLILSWVQVKITGTLYGIFSPWERSPNDLGEKPERCVWFLNVTWTVRSLEVSGTDTVCCIVKYTLAVAGCYYFIGNAESITLKGILIIFVAIFPVSHERVLHYLCWCDVLCTVLKTPVYSCCGVAPAGRDMALETDYISCSKQSCQCYLYSASDQA